MRRLLAPAAVLAIFALPAAPWASEAFRYDIRWAGVRVGEMTLERGVGTNGVPFKAMRVRSQSLASVFSKVDTEVLCESVGADGSDCLRVTKRVAEGGFSQHDSMRLWPATGEVVWDDLARGSSTTSRVEVGSQDVASFFFDLRDVHGLFRSSATNRVTRAVVMDGKSHEVVFVLGATNVLDTAWGAVGCREFEVESRSGTLFVRNVPKRIRVALEAPVLLEMDVESSMGTAHFRLREWTADGKAAKPAF